MRGSLVAVVAFSVALLSLSPLQAQDPPLTSEPTAEFVAYIRASADAGDMWDQGMLALMYFEGLGVPQDESEAVIWWRKAAEQGHTLAQYRLGTAYYGGRGGVPQDYHEATRWVCFAAEQGHEEAQYLLGLMYFVGMGVPEEPIQAHKWLNFAAARMSGDRFTKVMDFRNAIADEMSVGQLNTARKLAAEWKPSTWAELQASE